MILVTTASEIEGFRVIAAKGTVQGATFDDMLRHAETLGANAIVRAEYANALSADHAFHGAAVQVEPIPIPSPHLKGKEGSICEGPWPTKANRGPK